MIAVSAESLLYVEPNKLAESLAGDPESFADLMVAFCAQLQTSVRSKENPLGMVPDRKPFLDALVKRITSMDRTVAGSPSKFAPLCRFVDQLRAHVNKFEDRD